VSLSSAFRHPFAEQAGFFRQKLNLPSERWDGIRRAAHDRGFIVAGAMKADLIADLRRAVDKAITQGATLEVFRRDFDALVARHGWTGWAGEGSPGGIAWRTRVIYQTNLATSYAAGRWAQLNDPDLVALRPYLKYHHADGVQNPRPQHVAWNGLVLPRDHPFWKTHAPANGWGCHCYLSAASAADYRAAQASGKAAPPQGWDAINPKTGAPAGIDQGFDYAPGANADTALRDMVAAKLIEYPPAISRALSHDLNRYVLAHRPPSEFAATVLADREIHSSVAWLGFVENAEALQAATTRDLRGFAGILPADVPRHVERDHNRDGGDQRPIRPGDYDLAWQVLTEADHLKSGRTTVRGLEPVVATKVIAGETYRAVYEIRPGRKNRTLALVSLIVKTR
jgi:hypothetical protein